MSRERTVAVFRCLVQECYGVWPARKLAMHIPDRMPVAIACLMRDRKRRALTPSAGWRRRT